VQRFNATLGCFVHFHVSLLADGRVAYLLRKRRKNGATHLVMTQVQCIACIAALLPRDTATCSIFSGRPEWCELARRF